MMHLTTSRAMLAGMLAGMLAWMDRTRGSANVPHVDHSMEIRDQDRHLSPPRSRAPHMLLCTAHPATFPPAFFHSSARPILNPPIYFLSNPQHRAIILLTFLNHTDISTSYRRSVDPLKKYNALLIAPRRQWCRRTCFRADWYHHQLHHLLRGRAYICGP